MTIEAREIGDETKKAEWMQRIQLYKSQLQALQNDHARDELLDTTPSSSRLESAVDTASRQNETLQQALRSIQETEAIGQEISQELNSNRARLESSRNHVSQLSSLTSQAHGIMNRMIKRKR
jgi:methyl-accepting chemotaxis protein